MESPNRVAIDGRSSKRKVLSVSEELLPGSPGEGDASDKGDSSEEEDPSDEKNSPDKGETPDHKRTRTDAADLAVPLQILTNAGDGQRLIPRGFLINQPSIGIGSGDVSSKLNTIYTEIRNVVSDLLEAEGIDRKSLATLVRQPAGELRNLYIAVFGPLWHDRFVELQLHHTSTFTVGRILCSLIGAAVCRKGLNAVLPWQVALRTEASRQAFDVVMERQGS